MYDTDSEISENLFLNNTLVNGDGAGVRVECPPNQQLECVNIMRFNIFEGNQATGYGGAIASTLYAPI
jgi:predicted outer membrane repeat protein